MAHLPHSVAGWMALSLLVTAPVGVILTALALRGLTDTDVVVEFDDIDVPTNDEPV